MMRREMDGPQGLADRLWAETATLHREAERSGILQDLLRGRAGRDDYALLLAGLLPVYEALEDGLENLPGSSPLRVLARPELYRTAALRSDLATLTGTQATAVDLPAAKRYADRITRAADGSGELLLAHAYVRYLGDLNGGQILRRLLGKSLGLDAGQLGFYAFPALDDPKAFANDYRAIIDRIPVSPDTEGIVAEAQAAFRLNIELSEDVQRVSWSRAGSEA